MVIRIWRSRTKLKEPLDDSMEFLDRISHVTGHYAIITDPQAEPFVVDLGKGTQRSIYALRAAGYFIEDPVMYIEGDPKWRKDVSDALKGKYEISVFSNLADAKEAYFTGHHSVVICDGTLQNEGDGMAWARELHSIDQPVIVLSTNVDSDIPSIDKAEFEPLKFVNLLAVTYCRIGYLTKELNHFGEYYVTGKHRKIFDWIVELGQVSISLGPDQPEIKHLRAAAKNKFKEINEGAPPEIQAAFMTSIPADQKPVINSVMGWIAKAP